MDSMFSSIGLVVYNILFHIFNILNGNVIMIFVYIFSLIWVIIHLECLPRVKFYIKGYHVFKIF